MTEREEKARDWLNRNYGFSMELDAIQRRLDRMQADIEKCVKPIRLREVQEAQGLGNGTEERMADWIDMSAELEKKRLILLARDRETLKIIDMVDSPVLRTILIERYVNRRPWKTMDQVLHYDRATIFRYHLQALSAIIPFIPGGVT